MHGSGCSPFALAGLVCLGFTSWASVGFAGQNHASHKIASSAGATRYSRSFERYETPDLVLIDQMGDEVSLTELLGAPEPVALNFIFTTCTTICPVMSATFGQMARNLGPDADSLRMVSISIDPEYDSPRLLRRYAEGFNAGSNWRFLTGDKSSIATVLKAFRAYTGSKGGHRPISLLKGPGAEAWLRIEGLATGADLSSEYLRLLHP